MWFLKKKIKPIQQLLSDTKGIKSRLDELKESIDEIAESSTEKLKVFQETINDLKATVSKADTTIQKQKEDLDKRTAFLEVTVETLIKGTLNKPAPVVIEKADSPQENRPYIRRNAANDPPGKSGFSRLESIIAKKNEAEVNRS